MSGETATAVPPRRLDIRPDLFVVRENGSVALVGSRDRLSGQVFFPAEIMNPVTMTGDTLERHEFNGDGTLIAWTVIARGLPGFDQPYALGTIKLDAGPGFIGQLHDWQGKKLRRGMRVRTVAERIKREKDGTEIIGPKFVPLES